MSTRIRRLSAGLLTTTVAAGLTTGVAGAGLVGLATPAHATGRPAQVTLHVPPSHDGWYADRVVVGIEVVTQSEVEPSSSWILRNAAGVQDSGPLDVGTTDVEVTLEGNSTLAYVVETAGDNSTSGSTPLRVDATDPVITTEHPNDVPRFLQGSQQVTSFSCADALSGVAGCAGPGGVASPASLDTSTPGLHSFTVTATDVAGNTTTRDVTYDVLGPDSTPPTLADSTLSGTAGAGGWWISPVVAHVRAADPTVEHQVRSGLSEIDVDLDGAVTSAATSEREVLVGEGRHVVRWAARDVAGNPSGITTHQVNVDTVAPVADLGYPAEGQHLTPSSSATPVPDCSDATSGIATCGAGRLSLSPGRHAVTVRAVDIAGHVTTAERHYVVDRAPAHPVVGSTTRLSKVHALRDRAGSVRVVLGSAYAPRGRVVISDGSHRLTSVVVPARAAKPGRTSFVVPLPRLAHGRHLLRAAYSGAPDIRASRSQPVVVTVR